MEKQQMTGVQKIDIEKVFYSKNPGMARFIPGFVFSYLKKIIHQDFINDFLSRHGEKQDMEFVEAVIDEFNVTIEVQGEKNLPHDGQYIFVSNHPLGGFDGLVLMKVLSRHYRLFKFLVNDILMNIKNLNGLFIPINKHGKQGVGPARQIEETFQSEAQVLTFPAGLVSRRIKGQVVDLVWHKNFVAKALQYQRNVLPVFMSGRNTGFFYRLANLRKFLGIKANIEMLYLVDETYKHRNKHLVVKFGEPIPWQTFDKSRKPAEWAKWVKEKVYQLNGVVEIPL
ncbi:MAG: 1-acyl-sn-glycerol-3-phosphate acyltransferase [Bacteroidales bacterium]|nr:1-acyl-sn-glycerol-3-phosphate acyltransferase [Bacteroidales bacterium]